jgi:hypothetical protein
MSFIVPEQLQGQISSLISSSSSHKHILHTLAVLPVAYFFFDFDDGSTLAPPFFNC